MKIHLYKKMYPTLAIALDIDDESKVLNPGLKSKVIKYYGFVEIFKMKKESQNAEYEHTGKLNRLA